MEIENFRQNFFEIEDSVAVIRSMLDEIGINFKGGQTIELPALKDRKKIPYVDIRDVNGDLILVLRVDSKQFIVHQEKKAQSQISALLDQGFVQLNSEIKWDKEYLKLICT